MMKLLSFPTDSRKLKVYPKGNTAQWGKALSIFPSLDDWKILPPKKAFYAKFKTQMLDQVGGKHEKSTGTSPHFKEVTCRQLIGLT